MEDVGACLECKRTQIEKQRAEGSEHYASRPLPRRYEPFRKHSPSEPPWSAQRRHHLFITCLSARLSRFPPTCQYPLIVPALGLDPSSRQRI